MSCTTIFTALICFAVFSAKAQTQRSGWIASFNTFRLDNKWSIYFDAQLRSTDKIKNVQTFLLRPGINYHFNKSVSATLGYAFVHNRRTSGSVTDYVTEHRVWEQLLASHKFKTVSTSHRLRLEQRFLPVTTVNNNELEVIDRVTAHRLRYFIRNLLPFQKGSAFSKGFFAALQDEVFLNIANKDVVNGKTFDQNRFYVALGYRISKIDLELGYMNQYTKTASGSITNNIGQFAVYKRL